MPPEERKIPEASHCGVVIALPEEFRDKPLFDGFARVFATNPHPIVYEGNHFYTFEFLDASGSKCAGVVTVLFAMGPGRCEVTTRAMIRHFDPSLLINLGISGSLGPDARLGDIVVAQSSDEYDLASAVVDLPNAPMSLKFGGEPFHVYYPYLNQIQRIELEQAAAYEQWRTACAASRANALPADHLQQLLAQSLIREQPVIESGPLASGRSVVKSKAFRELLLGRNRKFMAVDMESSGFLRACIDQKEEKKRIIMRAISDFADDRKESLDRIGNNSIRAWAMENAYQMLSLIFRKVLTFDQMSARGSEPPDPMNRSQRLKLQVAELVKGHLDSRYRIVDVSDAPTRSNYARLFEFIVPEAPQGDGDIWNRIISFIQESSSVFPLRVDGRPGTGKTSLLSVLYLIMKIRSDQSESAPIPIYLDIKQYQDQVFSRGLAAAQKQLALDLDPVTSLLQEFPWQPVIFLIDGIDDYSHSSTELTDQLNELLTAHEERAKKIVGVGLQFREHRNSPEIPGFGFSEQVLWMRAVPSSDVVEVRGFVEAFQKVYALAANPKVTDAILAVADRFKLVSLDLFTASLIANNSRAVELTRAESLSQFYLRYCEDYLRRQSNDQSSIAEAARLAFRQAIRGDGPDPDLARKTRMWRLVHKHRTILDFLVAVHVVGTFEQIGRGDHSRMDDLNFVYPQDVNRFCKELATLDRKAQFQALAGIRAVCAKGTLTAKTHACYLAGRLSDSKAKLDARDFLGQCFRDFQLTRADHEPESLTGPELLYGRTLYISLAYLGDHSVSEQYIDEMMKDERWDDLNRGFHLEYYGDIPFDAANPMSHSDPVSGPEVNSMKDTFATLYNRIEARLLRQEYGLLDIEIYTLFSLAQHRHAVGALNDVHRQQLIALVPKLLSNARVARRVKSYLRLLQTILNKTRYHVTEIIEQLYRLKTELRSGWTERKLPLPRVESVAEHTFGCYLIGLIYLPERQPEWPDYDKREVLDMLMIHDLGEAIVGDVRADKKDQTANDREERAVEQIALSGTYLGVANLEHISDMWRLFEQPGDSESAKIARDIDKLENLLQLYLYSEQLPGIDLSDWRTSLKDNVQTEAGAHILRLFEDYYENVKPAVAKAAAAASS